ncbi:MAG: GIY-YIG nuclease family protein [Coriobacteriia bacterium]|nr:GIY-YIG nuclease family protein [Coriobacteriia bacterium]
MSDEEKGYVYILTNPSFKDDWVKIGKSSRKVNVRSKELDNTAVPLPFAIFATIKTAKYDKAERFIHKMIDMVAPDIRIRKGREFFNITPVKAYEILKLCAEQYDDAEIEIYDEDLINELGAVDQSGSTANAKPHQRAARLTFEMLGIPVGSELTFYSDDSITVTVVDKISTVRVDDLELKLSAAARYIQEKLGKQNQSGSYQGGLWFKYDGVTLTELRRRLGR